MSDQFKNLIIGLFVLAACTIIVFMILFLHPYVGDEGKILHVRFIDIDKVNVGTRVTFAGRPVGEVTEIRELQNARFEELFDRNEVYIWELTLRIDTGVEVFTTDQISVRTAGLLGERSIEISPRAPSPGVKPVEVTDQILYAVNPESLEDVISAIYSVAEKAGKSLDLVYDELEELKKGKFFHHLNVAMQNVDEITTVLNKPEQLTAILDDIHQIAQNMNETTARIYRGEGTVGRLVYSDDLYLRTTAVISKAQTLMDDINHYGLLFQNDKNWQRVRARRVNLMAKLSSPQQFRNFFDDEVNEISTSLSRVSMVLGEAENRYSYDMIKCNPEFMKVFADFLRRVEALEENLKMYDQQLMERNTECKNWNPEFRIQNPECISVIN